MATISKQQSLDRLTQAVRVAPPDDLAEIYNELFPEAPTTENEATLNPSVCVGKIITHINSGLEVEEILALWNVIFPRQRRVWFDEDEGTIHYDEKTEPVSHAD